MPSYVDLVLSIFFELIAIMIITVGFFVVIEKLKQTESRMHSAENEVIRLNRLIVILVTPKPKNVNRPIVKEIQRVIEQKIDET